MKRVLWQFALVVLMSGLPTSSGHASKKAISTSTGRSSAQEKFAQMFKQISETGSSKIPTHQLQTWINQWDQEAKEARSPTGSYHVDKVLRGLEKVLDSDKMKTHDPVDIATSLYQVGKALGLDFSTELNNIRSLYSFSANTHSTAKSIDKQQNKISGTLPDTPIATNKLLADINRQEVIDLSKVPERDVRQLVLTLEMMSDLFSDHVMEFEPEADEQDRKQQRIDNIRVTVVRNMDDWQANEGKSPEGLKLLEEARNHFTFHGNDRKQETVDAMLKQGARYVVKKLNDVTKVWLNLEWLGPGNRAMRLTRTRVHMFVKEQLALAEKAVGDSIIDETGAAMGKAWNAIYIARAMVRALHVQNEDETDEALLKALERQSGDPLDAEAALKAIVNRARDHMAKRHRVRKIQPS